MMFVRTKLKSGKPMTEVRKFVSTAISVSTKEENDVNKVEPVENSSPGGEESTSWKMLLGAMSPFCYTYDVDFETLLSFTS